MSIESTVASLRKLYELYRVDVSKRCVFLYVSIKLMIDEKNYSRLIQQKQFKLMIKSSFVHSVNVFLNPFTIPLSRRTLNSFLN